MKILVKLFYEILDKCNSWNNLKTNKKTHKSNKIIIDIIEKLSKILGSKGLAGGQSLDLLYENKTINFGYVAKEKKGRKILQYIQNF